jgi:glycosyltransferase involved in cell wall biosynthesis
MENRRDLPRLGIFRDFPEEGWPSMDLCAEMLTRHLRHDCGERIAALDFCPPFRPRLQRLPWIGRQRRAFNADRLLNRLWDYPRHAARCRANAEFFHLVDHSYSQLINSLPAERTGVYCHDLDTFRAVLDPVREPRPRWFRAMVRRILNGFQKAAIVFTSNDLVAEQIRALGLVPAERLVDAPLGVADEYRSNPPETEAACALWTATGQRPYLLHVGSCIPRKRIDILLDTFARLHASLAELRLIKVGGEWTAEQRSQIGRLGLAELIVHAPRLDRQSLAALYQRAALVLIPSEAEGFGLPVIEALACGAAVLGSDLAVFRAIANDTMRYAPVADAQQFAGCALDWLRTPASASAVERRLAQVQRYSWKRHAEIVADAYLRLRPVGAVAKRENFP